MDEALTAIAHTAIQPAPARAVLARKAPVALPPQICAPKTVLNRLRASGATEVMTVWLATSAVRRPQSSRMAPPTTAATESAAKAKRDMRRAPG